MNERRYWQYANMHNRDNIRPQNFYKGAGWKSEFSFKNYSGKIYILKTFNRSSVPNIYINASWLTNSISMGMSRVICLSSLTWSVSNAVNQRRFNIDSAFPRWSKPKDEKVLKICVEVATFISKQTRQQLIAAEVLTVWTKSLSPIRLSKLEK